MHGTEIYNTLSSFTSPNIYFTWWNDWGERYCLMPDELFHIDIPVTLTEEVKSAIAYEDKSFVDVFDLGDKILEIYGEATKYRENVEHTNGGELSPIEFVLIHLRDTVDESKHLVDRFTF